MTDSSKIVRDPIHGDIKVSSLLLKLLATPEVQRLHHIKQLGFAQLVFPGAHHTRFEHSLGAAAIMTQLCDVLDLGDDKDTLAAAALLHDIGHGPFSHTLESILMEQFGVDHVGLTLRLLHGDYEVFEPSERKYLSSPTVQTVLAKEGLDPKLIGRIIQGRTSKKPYLGQMLCSTIDVDQLDYLMRDAYYTGVAYGMIDLQRLLQTVTILRNKIMVKRKGVSVVESILMARGLMYSSVYFHKTVRIAELMLLKALEDAPASEPFAFYRMTDSEIIQTLKGMGAFQEEIMTRLKYRALFKQAYSASFADLSSDRRRIVRSLENGAARKEKEQQLEEQLKIPAGHLILDVPRQELLRTEPRINLTEIGVEDNRRQRSLDEFTPIASALRSRLAPDWAVMVITDARHRAMVSKRVQRYLFS
jgi:HD superfamily phosphohydrolase